MSGRLSGRPRFALTGASVIGAGLAVFQLTAGSVCPVYAVTGLPCPACGSTRAVLALLRGGFWESLRWHPLVLLLPVLAVLALCVLRFFPRPPRWWNALLTSVLVLYLAVYIARMVMWFPHTGPMTVNERGYFPRLWQLAVNFFASAP